jgi:hypothetical protein
VTRPSYPIDAPSEEQLRLNFREASSAVIYSKDPGTTVSHSQSAKSATTQTACVDLRARCLDHVGPGGFLPFDH